MSLTFWARVVILDASLVAGCFVLELLVLFLAELFLTELFLAELFLTELFSAGLFVGFGLVEPVLVELLVRLEVPPLRVAIVPLVCRLRLLIVFVSIDSSLKD